MQGAETVLAKREARAWGSGAARDEQRARLATQRNGHEVDTPPRMPPMNPAAGKNKQKRHENLRSGGEVSGSPTRSARRNDAVRENIIGHTAALVIGGLGGRCGFFGENGAFALIHEPASEHGGGVLLEILIEEGAQFLAEIGGVSEPGEFVGLEGVTGSGEEELPRWLRVVGVHENLLEQVLWKRRINSSTLNKEVTSNPGVTSLWKSVESVENVWGACSGCAGDYEDPDASAWEADVEENEEDTGEGDARKELRPGEMRKQERPEAE